MRLRRNMAFNANLDVDNQDHYRHLMNRLDREGIKYGMNDVDLGFGRNLTAITINQRIRDKDVQSHLFYGPEGGLYVSNPNNTGGVRPILSTIRFNKDESISPSNPLMSPVDRVINMIQNPNWEDPKTKRVSQYGLSTLAQKQGADNVSWQRLEAQPGLDRLFRNGVQLSGEKYSYNDKIDQLNRATGSDYVNYARVGAAYRAKDYEAVIPTNNAGGMLISKLKEAKLFTGKVSDAVIGRNIYEPSPEPFYFEGQAGPNQSVVLRGAFDLFSEIPEGAAFTAGLGAANRISRTVTLPRGTTYDPDTGGLTLANGTALSAGTYFGGKPPGSYSDYTRLGGKREYNDIFGVSMGSYHSTLIENIVPELNDRGQFTGRATFDARAITKDVAIKSWIKAEGMDIHRSAMPFDEETDRHVDTWMRLPDLKKLPALALKALAADMNNTEAFGQWFGEQASARGMSADWIAQNFQNGQVSKEATPLVTEAAIQRLLSKATYNPQNPRRNVPLGSTEYEAFRNVTFIHQGQSYNVLGNVQARDDGTYLAETFHTPRIVTDYATNVRTEHVRDTMRIKPGTLSIMAQNNPELFDSLTSIAQATRKNNRAFAMTSAFRANSSSEQRQAVQDIFGIDKLDIAQVGRLREEYLSNNTDVSDSGMFRHILSGLAEQYGEQALELKTPQGSMILPNARTIRAGLRRNNDNPELINNWSKSAAGLITALGDDSISPDIIQNMANDTYARMEEHSGKRGVQQKATSIELGRLGGFARSTPGIPDNMAITSLATIQKRTGIENPDEIRRMAAQGDLVLSGWRYPSTHAKDFAASVRLGIYEDQPQWYKDRYLNPGRDVYTSPEIMRALRGDNDGDRFQAVLNRFRTQAAEFGKSLTALTPRQVVQRAANAFESERTKFIKTMAERSGMDLANTPLSAFSSFSYSQKQMREDFLTEEREAKSLIGINTNTFNRSMGMAARSGAEQLFGVDSPLTDRIAVAFSSIENITGASALDRAANKDTALEYLQQVGQDKGLYRTGARFWNRSTGKTLTGPESQFQEIFKQLSSIGSNLEGEPVLGISPDQEYRQKLAPAIATAMLTRDEMKRLADSGELDQRINQMADMLTQRRATGEDISTQLLPLTGAAKFAEWGEGNGSGLGSQSSIGQWITGQIANNYRLSQRKDKSGNKMVDANGKPVIMGEFPTDWGAQYENAGKIAQSIQEFNTNLGKRRGNNTLEQAVRSVAGGGERLKNFLGGMFPGLAQATQRFAVAPVDDPSLYNPGAYLTASQWTSGTGVDDELLRLVNLNTTSAERSGVIAELMKSGAFQEYRPYSGPANNADKVGTRMENVLTGKLAAPENQQILMANARRRMGNSRADFGMRDSAGNLVVGDIKTKSRTGLMSDLLGPSLRGDIMGQVSNYITGTRIDGGERQTGDYGVVVGGIRLSDNPNMPESEVAAGFEQAHDLAMQMYSNSQMPTSWANAGWTQERWESHRQASMQAMQDIYAASGMKVAARVVTGEEAEQFLNARQGDIYNLKSIRPEHRAADMAGRAQQIMALRGGGNISGSGVGSPPPPNMPGAPPAPPSGDDGYVPSSASGSGGSGGGGSVVNNNTVYRMSNPRITSKQIAEAEIALEHLGEAAKTFATGSKEAREEMLKHYDALKTVSSYLSDVERAQRSPDGFNTNNPNYLLLQQRLGSGRAGGSAFGTINNAVYDPALSNAAYEAQLANMRDTGEEPPQSRLQRMMRGGQDLAERIIKTQGLFHAKLAFNMFAGSAIGAADNWQDQQAAQGMMLAQAGQLTFNQLMGSQFGTMQRRNIALQEGGLAYGQQVYSAYAPLINFAAGPDTAKGPLGAMAGIGVPAFGVAAAATTLTGSPLFGAVAGGVTAGIGTLGYMSSNAVNYQAVGAFNQQRNAGMGLQAMFQNTAGAAGAFWNDLGRGLGLVSDEDYQRYLDAPQFNDLIQRYSRGEVGRQEAIAQAEAMRFNGGDLMAGGLEAWVQSQTRAGASRETALSNYSYWARYNPNYMPGGDLAGQMTRIAMGGGDTGTVAQSFAGSRGISPFSQSMMDSVNRYAMNMLTDQQNMGLFTEASSFVGQQIGGVNQALRMAGLGSSQADLLQMVQFLQNGGSLDQFNAGLQSRGTAASLRMSTPGFFDVGGYRLKDNWEVFSGQGDFVTTERLQQQAMQAGQMYNQFLANGASPGDAFANAYRYGTDYDEASANRQFQMLQGNQRVISLEGVRTQNAALQTINPNTGMGAYYNNVNAENIAALRANNPFGLFNLTDEEARMGEMGWQNQILRANRGLEAYQYGMRVRQRDLGYALTTGNMFQAGGLFGADGMAFNPGDGRGFWQLEDASRRLNRAQQSFSYEQDTAQLGIRQREFELSGLQWQTNYELQQRQFAYNTQYQRETLGISRGRELEQQSWRREDLAFSRSQLDIGFAWNMEDADRNIRYARGREKRDLMRQKAREVIRYSMESSQLDRQTERNEQQVGWSQQDFERQKQYFEQGVQFQKEAMENQKKFYDQNRELDRQRLDLAKQAHDRQLGWMQEGWQIEDQRILLERQNYQLSYKQQVDMDTRIRENTLTVQRWSDAIDQAGRVMQERIAAINTAVSTGNITSPQAQRNLNNYSYTGLSQDSGSGSSSSGTGLPVNPVLNRTYTANDGRRFTYTARGWLPAGSDSSTSRYGQSGGFAQGGYTGTGDPNEVAGVVHKEEYVVPQGGALVVRGASEEQLKRQDRMIALLEKIADNPTLFQVVMGDGNKSKATPMYREAAARL